MSNPMIEYPPHLVPTGRLGGWADLAWEHLAMWCPSRLEALSDPSTELAEWEVRLEETVEELLGPCPRDPELRAAWNRRHWRTSEELFDRWKPTPEVSSPVWDPDPVPTTAFDLHRDLVVLNSMSVEAIGGTPLEEILEDLDPDSRARWDDMMANPN